MTAGHVDGLLNQMTQAGMLRDVVGVVVGELLRCDWSRERPEMPQTLSIEDVLEQYLTPLGSPCSRAADGPRRASDHHAAGRARHAGTQTPAR